jgi:hypothetical protein
VLADVRRIERWRAIAGLVLAAGGLAVFAFRRARGVAQGDARRLP